MEKTSLFYQREKCGRTENKLKLKASICRTWYNHYYRVIIILIGVE